jgi:hypothetical protein
MFVAVALALGACSTGVAQQESQMPDLSVATQKAQQALDSPVDLELNSPTLEAALGRIAATTGTAIRIDFGALMSREITLSQPAPPRLKGDSLRSAFEQLLPSAKGRPDSLLPISAHEGAIHIDPFRWPPYPRGGAFQQGRYVVNGRVVDEADRPVPGAVVRLYCWAWVMLTSTNDEGRFFATLPVNGALSIEAWDAAGKTRAWTQPAGERGGLGAMKLEPTLRLKPPKQVAVRVTDGEQPVPGASVLLVGAGFPYEAPLTSVSGETTVQIPADLEADSVVAWKDGAGLDYTASRRSGTSSGPGGPPLKTDDRIDLKLSRGPVVRFRVIDQSEKPVAGLHMIPWLLQKPDVQYHFNTTHFHGRKRQATDADGLIAFDWLPGWESSKVRFSGSDRRHSNAEVELTFIEASRQLQTIRLNRNATVRGRAIGMDGKPAADVRVIACGPARKQGDQSFAGSGIADVEGRFEFFLPPQRPYLIVALSSDGKQISPPEERFLDDPEREIDDVVLYLRPAIRVFGRMAPRDTTRDDAKPILRLMSDDFRTRADVKLPVTDSLSPVRAQDDIQVDLKPDGTFSVLAGPGRYEFVPIKNAPGIPIELTDQTEYEVEVPPL